MGLAWSYRPYALLGHASVKARGTWLHLTSLARDSREQATLLESFCSALQVR